ncbi:MAG: DegT/DnrJ/EryC1/StrS family aminotransferase [Thermoplasmata archaeon]
MKIQMNDFRAEYLNIKSEIDSAVERVLSSGWYILGNEVKNFERKFSEYIGTKYAVGVNSGTDALLLSLMALGIKEGDEVITVSHTTTPTVMPILLLHAKPVFVDVFEDTLTIDTTKIEKNITEKTRAIIPVHLYGNPCAMEEISEISKKYSIPVIEDCCQAHGARYLGKKVGNFGILSAFSFYPTKNVGGYGDGGIVLTNDRELYERIMAMRQYGWVERYNSEIVGINSRLDELQAAILSVKLNHLDEWNEKRRKNAKLYNELLGEIPALKLPMETEGGVHVYHQYVIRTHKRDYLIKYLKEKGVQTQIHYPFAVHQQTLFKALGFRVDLPVTEKIVAEILSLPVHPFLSEEDIQTVCRYIKEGIQCVL